MAMSIIERFEEVAHALCPARDFEHLAARVKVLLDGVRVGNERLVALVSRTLVVGLDSIEARLEAR